MRKSALLATFSTLALCYASLGLSQVPDAELRTLGLETAWQTQARVPADSEGIVSADVWVDETTSYKYAVVDLPGSTMVRVAANKLDSKNRPIGIEAAKAEALAIAAKISGQSTGIDVAEVNVPALKLVVTTTNGLVQTFDAETGKLLWATPCGPTDTLANAAALSSAGVVVTQGGSLYVLDWVTGKQILTKELRPYTSSAVAVIDGQVVNAAGTSSHLNAMALVSDFSGDVKAIEISEKITPFSHHMLGRAAGRPVASPTRESVAIPAVDGKVYVFSGSKRPQIDFRYEAQSGITGSLAPGNDGFYVGGNDGGLAKVSYDGRIHWTFHLSHPIASPALYDVENKTVFVSSESGEFSCVDDASGYEAWQNSVHADVRGPIGIAGSSVICRTNDDRLVALDRKTGQIVGSTNNHIMLPAMSVNAVTNRIYLIGNTGQIQCLRAIGRDLPRVFKAVQAPVEKPEQPSSESNSTEESPADNMDSPFGDDPFGSTPAAEEPGMESGADPFGASSADPFGGNN